MAALSASLAASAAAAPLLYWSNCCALGHDVIQVMHSDGSSPPLSLYGNLPTLPGGIALDPARGMIYWATPNYPSEPAVGVEQASLDGSSSPQTLFADEHATGSLAIDSSAGRLYFTDDVGIRTGSLDGSGAYSTLIGWPNVTDIAVDPGAGRIYWIARRFGTRPFPGSIYSANLDGSGPVTTIAGNEDVPSGLAIDPAQGKIYWGGDYTMRVANLNGSGSPSTLMDFLHPNFSLPRDLALDPVAGKIYWTDAFDDSMAVGNLDGSGYPTEIPREPIFHTPLGLALLRPPTPLSRPSVAGADTTGDRLRCDPGEWADNVDGASFYRAPTSLDYQWQRGSADVKGADQATFVPVRPGNYRCRVTAANEAGSTTRTSDAVAVTSTILSPHASPATTVGGVVTDTAAITGGQMHAGGTLTAWLYGPDDPDCSGSPVYSHDRRVQGDGTYRLGAFIPRFAGIYRWTVRYSGDANNPSVFSACNAPNQSVRVQKATPTLQTAAALIGTHQIRDRVRIVPVNRHRGELLIRVYGPGDTDCSSAPVFTDHVAVGGRGVYYSQPFRATLPGRYRFTVRYSGDGRNRSASSPCNAPGESVRVPPST